MDSLTAGDERWELTDRALDTAFQAAKYQKHIFNKSAFPDAKATPITYEQSLDFIDLILEGIDLERRLWNTSILGGEWEKQRSDWQDVLLQTRDDISLSKEENPNWNNFTASTKSVWKAYNKYKSEQIERCINEKNHLIEISDESTASKLQLTYMREYIEFRHVYDMQMKRERALSDIALETLNVRQEMIEKYKKRMH